MTNKSYITIQGWMIENLDLKGNELILFAVIYGFSQNLNSEYKGSLTYISKGLKLSRRSVISLLKKLIEKDLIIKIENSSGNSFKYNDVTVNKILSGEESTLVKKVHQGGEESTPVSGEESTPNNNNNTNTINYTKFLEFLNSQTGRDFRVINKTVKGKYAARLKEGYKKEDIINSIINATKIQSHKENGCQYLTPEFFSRSSTLDKYGFETAATKKEKEDKVDFKEARKGDTHFNF